MTSIPPRSVKPPPTQLLLLHRDRLLRERLLRATRDTHQIRFPESWTELARTLDRAPTTALAVVDPYHDVPGRVSPSPLLYALLRDLPSATVVAAMELSAPRWDHVRCLGSWGVAQIIAADEEVTLPALRQRLGTLRGGVLRLTLEAHLPPTLTGRARAVILQAAEVASAGGGAAGLCVALHVSLRTLLRWCVDEGLPPPRRLLAWMRLLLAAALLEDPGRTVLGVAFASGYYSDNTMRRALKELLGRSPTRLRQEGALAFALRGFLTEIHHPAALAPAPLLSPGPLAGHGHWSGAP
jgi:AraC-like DNA-binding protein